MELRQTNHLSDSTDVKVVKPSEKNNSDKRGIYEMIFSADEDSKSSNTHNESNHSNINKMGRKFGSVSTLDWLKTWRSTEINQVSSSDPGK